MKLLIFGAVSALTLNAILDLNGSAAGLMLMLFPASGFTSPSYLLILGLVLWLYITVGRQHFILLAVLSKPDDPFFNDYTNRALLPRGEKIGLYTAIFIQVVFWPLTQLAASLFARPATRR